MKKSMKSIHGKEETTQPSTLDQVWGDTGFSKYKTLDVEQYKKELEEMNLSDLQSHARKHQIFPNENKPLLIKKLLKEFSSYASSFHKPKNPQSTPKQPSKEALRILSEGR